MPGPRPPLVQAVQLEKRYMDGPAVLPLPAGPDLRGRAAARGGGARPRPAPEAPPRRRADRQPGPGHRRGRPAAHVRAQPGARRGARGRDPQRPPGGGDGADAPPGGRRAPRAGLRAAGTRTRHDVVRRLAMARHARRRSVALLAALALVAGEVPLDAQGEPSIARVGITGNLRVEEDAIRVHLRSQPGQPFDQDTIDRDIRPVYAMGFFDQVDADVTRLP